MFAAWATITGVEDAAKGRSAFVHWGDEAGLVPKDARVPSAFVPPGLHIWETTCAEVTADFVRVLEDLSRGQVGQGMSADLGRLGELVTYDALGAMSLPIHVIEPSPDNPRTRFDEGALVSLAESIATVGVIQPIVVRPSADEARRDRGG